MTTLLLGAGGQLGHELRTCLAAQGRMVTSRRQGGTHACDLASGDAIGQLLESVRPRTVVNAAAYTAVDQAESEPDAAFALNRDAPARIAAWCKANDALLVHFSTDYVFDGRAQRPYRECDPVSPVNVYGASKLAGERAIDESGCRHLILRTSWVYGPHGRNFVKTICRAARQRDQLHIVDDQWGTPTSAAALARTVAAALALAEPPEGLYHLSASGDPVTWHGFASAFLALDDAATARIEPVATEAFPTPAARPRWSVLDNARWQAATGLAVATWQAQLDQTWPAIRQSLEPGDN